MNNPWGASGVGRIEFKGDSILDTSNDIIFNAALSTAEKVFSTDNEGNTVLDLSLSVDNTFAVATDTEIASKKAIKDFVEALVPTGNDGVKIRGSFDITTNPAEYPKALAANAVNATQIGDGSDVVTFEKAVGKYFISQIVGN